MQIPKIKELKYTVNDILQSFIRENIKRQNLSRKKM